MHTTALIRRHIERLDANAVFITREMLQYGSRGAVDMALYRMVKMDEIVRLAWGVFVKTEQAASEYTVEDVAKIKADVFARKLTAHPEDLAYKLGMTAAGCPVLTYCSDGSTTSFLYRKKRLIRFKRTSPRKLFLGDTPAGIAIKSLWFMGLAALSPQAVAAATHDFGRFERQAFREAVRWMPWWLSNYVNRLFCFGRLGALQ